jgi:hypothetical protein
VDGGGREPRRLRVLRDFGHRVLRGAFERVDPRIAASNWCTVLGALCFFIGALLVLPRRHAKDARAAGRPIVTKEV